MSTGPGYEVHSQGGVVHIFPCELRRQMGPMIGGKSWISDNSGHGGTLDRYKLISIGHGNHLIPYYSAVVVHFENMHESSGLQAALL